MAHGTCRNSLLQKVQRVLDFAFGRAYHAPRSPMHLQQTKRDSRGSGGPQYYFHNLSLPIKAYLRDEGAVRVALVTPYGPTRTDYFAVSKKHKLDQHLKPVAGSVDHDRIQQGRAAESIGEAIRVWYGLPAGDFERIDVDIDTIDDDLYLTPLKYKYADEPRTTEIPRIERPLTFTKSYKSAFWTQQLARINQTRPGMVSWALGEICRVVRDHLPKVRLAHVQEADLLRASGPLKHLGLSLGGYVGKGYDCLSEFAFLKHPAYPVPVEIKKHSQNFHYQQKKYGKELLSRAVVLCAIDDHKQMPKNIDVIELQALCDYAKQFPPMP
jgi:hypothetical protein